MTTTTANLSPVMGAQEVADSAPFVEALEKVLLEELRKQPATATTSATAWRTGSGSRTATAMAMAWP